MRPRRFAGATFFTVLLAFPGGPVRADGTTGTPVVPAPADSVLPVSDDAFVAAVRTAVANRDIDFFDKHLIDWDGARKRTQRLTLFQVRACFGRPIKSVGIEPWRADPTAPLVPDGYRTNLPVTHLLRIAFDEKHDPSEAPACVLMLSKNPKASYRMVLVLPTAPPPK